MSPRSGPARLAGERGCGMISANFMPFVNAKAHWETYCGGAERGGIAPDWRKWRLGRSIFVADSDAEADAYLARPNNSIWWDDDYFWRNLGTRGRLGICKQTPATPDADITAPRMIAATVHNGSPVTVLALILEIIDTRGPFGRSLT